MPYLVVEYIHDPPLTDEALSVVSDALRPCLEVRNIRRLRSWVSEDRRRGICEFEAPDTQSLRDAYHSAKVRFERVWAGKLFEFGTPQLP
jgi:2-C-methyl-D-erythritol 4-phosphate cytidylyltransferase